jgi:hypothetical protein
MRAMRPGMVRAPWRSSESCPLRVSKTDSNPLADRAERAVAARFVLAIGSEQAAAEIGDELLEVGAGEALVGDHGAPGERQALQDLGGRLALGDVGGDEVKADRHPVGGAHQDQPKAPEEAVLAAAVAVGGVTGQLRASRRLA